MKLDPDEYLRDLIQLECDAQGEGEDAARIAIDNIPILAERIRDLVTYAKTLETELGRR